MIDQSKKCDKGWHDGSCCCNCQSFIKLSKHPWNSGDAKGSVKEPFGFACIVQHQTEGNNRGTFCNKGHGFCELHVPLEVK